MRHEEIRGGTVTGGGGGLEKVGSGHERGVEGLGHEEGVGKIPCRERNAIESGEKGGGQVTVRGESGGRCYWDVAVRYWDQKMRAGWWD